MVSKTKNMVCAQTFMFGVDYEKLVAEVAWAFREEFSMVGCSLDDEDATRVAKAYVAKGAMDHDIYDLDLVEVQMQCRSEAEMIELLLKQAEGWEREAADVWLEQGEMFPEEVLETEEDEEADLMEISRARDPYTARIMELEAAGLSPPDARAQAAREFTELSKA